MRPTVYLFDIDGTLLLTGGAGRRSMRAAFADVDPERGPAAIAFSFAGLTDHGIVRTGLLALGTPAPDEAAINRVLDHYLARLEDEVARADGYQIMPGVLDVLELLFARAANAPFAIGLGTGNVKRGAYTKLARGALDARFAFGGFGCDAEDRTALLGVGAARGAALLGLAPNECRLVVIGDTPKDVTAALGIGAECIGVGTGGFAPEALAALGARHAFATLAEAGVHAALLDDPGPTNAPRRAGG
jgi:phosphoglycolate phosphatase-like HAD superfamily hydrolase